MEQLIIRAAQSAFNKAGYDKATGYAMAQEIATHMLANLSAYQAQFGEQDEFELAYKIAQAAVGRGALAA